MLYVRPAGDSVRKGGWLPWVSQRSLAKLVNAVFHPSGNRLVTPPPRPITRLSSRTVELMAHSGLAVLSVALGEWGADVSEGRLLFRCCRMIKNLFFIRCRIAELGSGLSPVSRSAS